MPAGGTHRRHPRKGAPLPPLLPGFLGREGVRERRGSPGAGCASFSGPKCPPVDSNAGKRAGGEAPWQPEPAELAPLVTPLRGRAPGSLSWSVTGSVSGVSELALDISVFYCPSPTPSAPSGTSRTVRASGGTAVSLQAVPGALCPAFAALGGVPPPLKFR